ncbi:hypothetical protein GXW74_06645 [Roseomonas eburnea]|uniref:Uncharacterized protein n=1 Tax=Neoroseomonas eburnea TaxID=1346889 RepID=A0A9X9X8X2_9PROT|nr:hypothetical protein [Neoroseomonas eburnea]MBR0680158.1 hypothetical protein [Neoroseomonas eburnea]
MMIRGAFLLAAAFLPARALAQAETFAGQLPPEALASATSTVLILFLIAVLLESALAVLFNWRPFVETFNARATRPLLAFVVAYVFVATFQYDAVTALVNAVRRTPQLPMPQMLGQVMTAAILAGGSSGVNTLLVSLGFREVRTPATELPKVPPDRAWVAISVEQERTAGQVLVLIGKPPAEGAPATEGLALAGVIPGGPRGSGGALRRFFLRDVNRFPPFGGYQVPSAEPCRIVLRGRAKKEEGGEPIVSAPLDFVPAKGAIIDLAIRL